MGLDVGADTVRVASAKIEDELNTRNQTALTTLKLRAGDRVVKRTHIEIGGQRDEFTQEFTISSIHQSGRLFFTGGNGLDAWPTEVEKIDNSTAS